MISYLVRPFLFFFFTSHSTKMEVKASIRTTISSQMANALQWKNQGETYVQVAYFSPHHADNPFLTKSPDHTKTADGFLKLTFFYFNSLMCDDDTTGELCHC